VHPHQRHDRVPGTPAAVEPRHEPVPGDDVRLHAAVPPHLLEQAPGASGVPARRVRRDQRAPTDDGPLRGRHSVEHGAGVDRGAEAEVGVQERGGDEGVPHEAGDLGGGVESAGERQRRA